MDAQERIESALFKAIKNTDVTCDATEAVTKVAKDMDLNPNEIASVVAAYNTSKGFKISQASEETYRTADFDLADVDKVLEQVFPNPVKKVASEAKGDRLPLPSLDSLNMTRLIDRATAMMEGMQLQKTAAEKPVDERTQNICLRKIAKCTEEEPVLRGELLQKIKSERDMAHERMLTHLKKSASEFTKYPQNQREKIARRVVNGFQHRGPLMLEAISVIANTEVPEVVKTASHSILPQDNFFAHLAEADQEAARVGTLNVLREQLTKTSGIDDIAEQITGSVLPDTGYGAAIRSHLGRRERPKLLREKLAPDTFTTLKGLEARNAFMRALTTNPDLMNFQLPELQEAFNYAVETNPTLVQRPRTLSNVILHNVNQRNIDDIYALKGKQDLEKGILDQDKIQTDIQKNRQTMDSMERREQDEMKEKAQVDIPKNIGFKNIPEKIQKGIKNTVDTFDADMDRVEKKQKKQKEEDDKKVQELKDRLPNFERKTGAKVYGTSDTDPKKKVPGIVDTPIHTENGSLEPLGEERFWKLQSRVNSGTASQEEQEFFNTLIKVNKAVTGSSEKGKGKGKESKTPESVNYKKALDSVIRVYLKASPAQEGREGPVGLQLPDSLKN